MTDKITNAPRVSLSRGQELTDGESAGEVASLGFRLQGVSFLTCAAGLLVVFLAVLMGMAFSGNAGGERGLMVTLILLGGVLVGASLVLGLIAASFHASNPSNRHAQALGVALLTLAALEVLLGPSMFGLILASPFGPDRGTLEGSVLFLVLTVMARLCLAGLHASLAARVAGSSWLAYAARLWGVATPVLIVFVLLFCLVAAISEQGSGQSKWSAFLGPLTGALALLLTFGGVILLRVARVVARAPTKEG